MMCSATSNLDDAAPMTETTDPVNTASVSDSREEESMQNIGKLIQDLFHSDNAKVNAALDALVRDLRDDKKRCEKIQDVGGCDVLVQLVKNCLEKAIEKIPASDQVTNLNKLAGDVVHRGIQDLDLTRRKSNISS
jgi:hypothetical protein